MDITEAHPDTTCIPHTVNIFSLTLTLLGCGRYTSVATKTAEKLHYFSKIEPTKLLMLYNLTQCQCHTELHCPMQMCLLLQVHVFHYSAGALSKD